MQYEKNMTLCLEVHHCGKAVVPLTGAAPNNN